MTPKEKKKLVIDFNRAQLSETRSFSKQEKAELKALTSDQASRKKAWSESEKKSRRVFFEQHMSGPERRSYIQDYLKRKKAYELMLKNELEVTKSSWKEKATYLKKLQKERESQFKAKLELNQRPDASLWPKS